MRYRYDHRVGIIGLALAAVILAVGFLTGHRQLSGSLAMATVVTSTLVAHYRVPSRSDDTDREDGMRH